MAEAKIDYEESAIWCLDAAARQDRPERVAELQRRGQTFATLALVEQQRIANRIALGEIGGGPLTRDPAHLSRDYLHDSFPDVAKALRIETKREPR